MTRKLAILMVVVAVPIVALAATSSGARRVAGLDSTALLNAEYQVPTPTGARVRLRDGKWAVEDAQGRQSVTVVDLNLRGDLNGDGSPDAVVLLAYWGGGSGIFNYLAVVVNEQGQPHHLTSVELGDRVQVKSVVLRGGRIEARLVVQGDNDPACCPTVLVTRVFSLAKNELIEVGGA